MKTTGGASSQPASIPLALLEQRSVLPLWLSQSFSLLAQYALLFTLLVLVVEITGSGVYTSLLILSFVIPSLTIGLLVGVLVDRWGKATVMVSASVIRAAACLFLFFFHESVWLIYAVNLVFATANQFFNPAVAAYIPSLVPRERLMEANSLYNLTLTGAQFLGMVFLAPLFIKTTGEEGMFLLAAVLFVLAAVAAFRLHRAQGEQRAPASNGTMPRLMEEVRQSWQVLKRDVAAAFAMLHLILGSTLVLLFAILVPIYMNDIIEVAPDNAAFVFAPVGVGAIIGLRSLRWFSARWAKIEIVIIGLAGLAASLIALSLVEQIADALRQTEILDPDRLGGISLLVALTMMFSGPIGFFYALLNAPAQTILHERAPAEMRGRLFASQIALANAISLAPILLVGGIADLVGVSWVLVLVAMVLLGIAAISFWWHNQNGLDECPPANDSVDPVAGGSSPHGP